MIFQPRGLVKKIIMIPSRRKVGHGLFEALMKKGRFYPTEHFSCRVFFSGVGGPAKFSVVVPKKIEKSAVKRNAAKRRLYAALRPFLPAAKPGSLCGFFLKKKFDGRALPFLALEMAEVLKKAGIIA